MAEQPNRPKRILYGVYYLHEALCFFDETYIRELDAEVSAVKWLSTIGEGRELSPRLVHTYVPGLPEYDDEMDEQGLTLDSPYVWDETLSVQQGDWPPMPTALSLRTFGPDDHEAWAAIYSPDVAGTGARTAINGPILEIPMANEAALLAAFDRLGLPYVRDDAVVENLGRYGYDDWTFDNRSDEAT